MVERRKYPRTPNAKGFALKAPSANRSRNVDIQGQGPEHSPADRNPSPWLGGWLLGAVAGASEGAPQTPSRTVRNLMNSRLRVGVFGCALAAAIMSTNALGTVAEISGSIANRVKASITIAKQSVTAEVLAPLLEIKPRDDAHASTGSYKRADNKSCVRPEVYRAAPDLNRFWWLLRDANGRTINTAPNTYASETEARIAADDAATKHACTTRVTATNVRNGKALSSTN